MKIDKSKLKDSMGRPLTQGLFLETNWGEFAIFTLEDEDKEFRGKFYPSLKKLYLAMEDPNEYEFSKTYLLGWSHWQRLNGNKLLRPHFDIWREELMLSIKSSAIKSILDQALEGNNFQAAKWLAEGGWDKKPAGRPSKEQIEKHTRINEKLKEEYNEDIERLKIFNVVK